MALVSVDNPVDLGDIIAGIIGEGIESIDLNQDIISLPPETATEIIIEVEIATEGEHTLYIYFLPTVDDSLIPLNFGGGLREISLCGNIRPCGTPAPEPPPPLDGVTELKPEFQFTADCGLEYQLRDQEDNIVQNWQVVPGWVENAALCFGAGMATKEDIKQALIEWTEDTASRYLGLTLDEDGNPVIPPGEGEGGAVVDDPLTPQNEASEARAGGCISVVAGYNQIWADMLEWHEDSLLQDVVSYRLQAKYLMVDDASTDNFVALYYSAFATGHINAYTTDLTENLFCGGANFKKTVAAYIIESVTLELQENALELNDALSDEQIAAWFSEGAAVPTTDYIEYHCVPVGVEEFTLSYTASAFPQFPTTKIHKPGHRLLIETTGGIITDPDNAGFSRDLLYVKSNTGVITFEGFFMSSSGLVPTTPITQAGAPYSATATYRFTVDLLNNAGEDSSIIFGRNVASFAGANIAGSITIKVTDLGAYVAP